MGESPAIGSRGELPDGGLARIKEALARAWSYLDDEARAKLAALQDEETLWALAVIVAVWGGFQLTPVGWIADAILAVVGAFAVTTDLIELLGGGADAVTANTPEQFDQAARRMAKGIAGLGIDFIAGIIGGTLLATLRRGIRWARGTKGAGKFFEPVRGDRVIEAPKTPAKAGFGTSLAADVAIGAAVGVGAVKAGPVASQAWNDTKKALNIGLPIVGGLVLIGGIWALSSSRREKRR